jgi:hypothetical protein
MTSFLTDAAKYYAAQPHQDAAWEYLWDSLDEYTQTEFMVAYRGSTEDPEGLITLDVFEELTGYSASLFKQQEADDCNRLLSETGFEKDISATRMLMANMMHETCNFKYMDEIASGEAYNNRSDLGNGPTDGPTYKGAGVLMLTGRYNYQRFSDAIGDPRVMEGVNFVSKTYPFMSAKTWIEENNLLQIAQNLGFDEVCFRINGGWNGYEDRLAKYQICKDVL